MAFKNIEVVSAMKRSRVVERSFSLASQMCHLVALKLEKPPIQYDTAMFIISIDVDVGSKKLGLLNEGKNDANVHNYLSEVCVGEIEESVLPSFFDTFSIFEVPATFAIRGQLTELDDSVMDLFLKSSIKHDIGSHGYFHRNFKALSKEEAEKELCMTEFGLKRFGVTPKSFIFPRNAVRHLDLLEKFGYKCYRECGTLLRDGMFIQKRGQLYNIQPSLYLSASMNSLLLKKILDIAVDKRAPLHIWFHMWNFGLTDKLIDKYIKNVFSPFLKYAKAKEKEGLLTLETMLSAAQKADDLFAKKKRS